MNFTQFIYVQYLLNRFLVQSLRKPEKNIIPPPEKKLYTQIQRLIVNAKKIVLKIELHAEVIIVRVMLQKIKNALFPLKSYNNE